MKKIASCKVIYSNTWVIITVDIYQISCFYIIYKAIFILIDHNYYFTRKGCFNLYREQY